MSKHDHTAIPGAKDLGLLSVGVVGIGTSGPIIAASIMPVPSLIFWRNLGGALMMLPFALRRAEWRTKDQQRAIAWSALAGFFLAMHFICFFLAMRYTSVATAPRLPLCNRYLLPFTSRFGAELFLPVHGAECLLHLSQLH